MPCQKMVKVIGMKKVPAIGQGGKREVSTMTFKEFKKTHLGGYNTLLNDEMQPSLNGVYTVFLR